ncbi:FAD-dependent monooxygenase [Arthrobacter sp. SD76]|uniref:FAD-dependent monooxygenase n=1 Tax=Arthrobacter sp. SD76 TaxID=3415007 RepID=UPI003C75CA5E
MVGAGPAGLTAALQAHAHGATVRVVDRRADRIRPSRAMMLHARALEGLRPWASPTSCWTGRIRLRKPASTWAARWWPPGSAAPTFRTPPFRT